MNTLRMHTENSHEEKDRLLRERVQHLLETRRASGLEGLTGDLSFVIMNTEPENQRDAVVELLRYTGYAFVEAFEDDEYRTCVLKCRESADLLVRCRLGDANPFRPFNRGNKSGHIPDTRLEALVFSCTDLNRYCALQQKRSVTFMTERPVKLASGHFIQTPPSAYTGNSIGLVEWSSGPENYRSPGSRPLDWRFDVSSAPWKNKLGTLDHIATRVKAEHRDPAILEFMELTDYHFEFAIYVPDLNSITNVARRAGARFAQVFTSGIAVNPPQDAMGPTEMFVQNYGARAHHMAFLTEDIEATDRALRADGLGFLSDLVGSESDGIKQSFSAPSPNTLLVNEYIKRYGNFDGFFTQHNVTQLTLATAKQ